jgi:hypothetical protein
LLLATLVATFRPAPAAASGKAVDCAALAVGFETKDGFELNCEAGTDMLPGMEGGSVEKERLEATANDGTTFVDARYFDLLGRVYFTNPDLRANFGDFYGKLEVKNWQSGQAVSTLTTAEFAADMRGLPSKCVAFQKLAHHAWDGYKKLMIGVSCTQGDLSLAYAALKHLRLPD